MAWQDDLAAFAETLQHPAWGITHARRVLDLAARLARDEGLTLDRESLEAAALVHDIGAFPPYRIQAVDHAVRGADLAADILLPMGFPRRNLERVEQIIRGHMFYADPSEAPEAVCFHDADTLDFLGLIGVTRLLSIVGLDDWAPDVPAAVALIERFRRELPPRLRTGAARREADGRLGEMDAYLTALRRETADGSML
jgi:uncharacterized protein